MDQPIQIDEIIGKTTQGMSGVHRCEGEDGEFYYVKGYKVGREDQAKEWICGHLAKEFGLPVADFCLVEINECLYHSLRNDSLRDAGHGICFGSREVKQANWLEPNKMPKKVSNNLKSDILVFDWWVKNCDRTPDNPNLLWTASEQKLSVIDHNLAFDCEFDEASFFKTHIFSGAKDTVFGDMVAIQEYQARMDKAITVFESAVDTVKRIWPWHDLEETRPFELDSEALLATLEMYRSSEFWSMK
ncbi:hypothetical protein M3P05_15450 [Sansalvadorimonas sp. 2012CJ34-2]|uniref:HipA-like kinase domain-containing protein n=1 Tax=Parendozoicomonas callyspongiae TaxID=2942213 RepID=A0ABT0PIZ1_9GAMM|nr:HipA family kinase [Sansalvadorimonas sp. 2012CJ34-2]MCL6271319.1 hypothetical protein [Sansalvadorimonas sp. 2012CJ34-2]